MAKSEIILFSKWKYSPTRRLTVTSASSIYWRINGVVTHAWVSPHAHVWVCQVYES